VYAENLGGTLDIFDHSPYKSYTHLDVAFVRQPHYVRNDNARPTASVPPFRPAVDRFEELLTWAEQQATANGIVPPYLQEVFTPAAESGGVSDGGREEASTEPEPMDEDDLGLPPLQAVPVLEGQSWGS
jgi:hypothetical protein